MLFFEVLQSGTKNTEPSFLESLKTKWDSGNEWV